MPCLIKHDKPTLPNLTRESNVCFESLYGLKHGVGSRLVPHSNKSKSMICFTVEYTFLRFD